jgi:HSP20 family molecular chaperone IbpA
MSHTHDSTSRYRPHVHWKDESTHSFQNESPITNIKKNGQRISLNASLPFYSKLNIRIHANRIHHNQVKATATIQRLDPQYEHEYIEGIRQAYIKHYSTLPSDENLGKNLLIQSDKLPMHHQISLPVSLPIDKRLFLYIRNGEIFARC